MKVSKFFTAFRKVERYAREMLPEKAVHPWNVIRYCMDIRYCSKRYGSSIADYFELHFYEKTKREREAYFTADQALDFINRVNGKENNLRFYDKNYMYQILGTFTKREQLFCPAKDYQEVEAFFLRHPKAIFKPNHSYCGTGIEIWSADDTEIRELYERASKQQGVLDEPVVQHPDLARLNPDSINTVKIYTMMIRDVCHFVAAELRIGRRGSFVDNLERGGLAAGVDLETGAVVGKAYDLRMKPYSVHPDTGVALTGFTLPHWTELLHFTEECARTCPIAYVEWDFAIRVKDCVLIEANANARNTEIQMGEFHGRKKQFEELLELWSEQDEHG